MSHPGGQIGRVTRRLLGATVLTMAALAPAAAQKKGAAAPSQLQVGDRIALTIEAAQPPFQPPYSDTVAVREGGVIRIPNLGDINVNGVRRSDTQQYLTQQISKYIRNPVVHATPLVHIAVLGQVGRPGFYSVPTDLPLSDVVMRAGGPTTASDLNKTEIKRGGSVVVDRGAAQNAFASGETLDQLRVAPGDELVVGEKSHINLQTVLGIAGTVVSIVSLLYWMSR